MKTNFHLISMRPTCTLFSILALLVLGSLSGCKAYHLGSPVEIPFQSLYVRPVSNQSFAPQAQAIISSKVRESLLRDGRVHVVAKEADADAVLIIELIGYERNTAARNSQDTTIADIFDLRLMASVSLLDQTNGRYRFENRMVEAAVNVYASDPYADTQVIVYHLNERQAMERIAREIARKITDEVLSPW